MNDNNYYSISNMVEPTREVYNIADGKTVLLIGTAKRQDWATSIDIDINSPCNIVADGLHIPFAEKSFDYVILDYVTNFLPKEYMIELLVKEARRVGVNVLGRATVTGKRENIKGLKTRYTHKQYPSGVQWMDNARP